MLDPKDLKKGSYYRNNFNYYEYTGNFSADGKLYQFINLVTREYHMVVSTAWFWVHIREFDKTLWDLLYE